MDGFRDRMNRGTMDRGSYDRYDRGSRRGSYGAPAAPQASMDVEEIAQIVEDSNAKQLDVIGDFFEDAKVDRFESEKQIITAISDVMNEVKEVKKVASEQPAPVVQAAPQEDNSELSEISKEILKTANSNADLLAQFAEEQVPMLIRGNSAVLNQIREALLENDETLRELVRNSNMPQTMSSSGGSSNDEVLSTATTNNALLNALRADVAAVQSEIRSTNERMSANADDSNAPLDSEDGFTKAHADEMYKNIEDMVHGECVKVYRNVQKVLEDQNVAIAETVKSGVGGVKGLVIVNLILLILNLVATIVKILGII